MLKKYTLSFFIVSLLLSTIWSTVGMGESQNQGTQTGAEKDRGQNLNVYIDWPLSYNLREMNLDPQHMVGKDYYLIVSQVMEGLMRLDEEDNPTPGMAEQIMISDDGREYTFKLREANWSDGSAVTADNFKYAWLRAIELDSPLSFLLDNIVGVKEYRNKMATYEDTDAKAPDAGGVAIRVLDRRTLKVTLQYPDPGFLSLVTVPVFYPAKQSFVDEKGSNYGFNESNLLYNGPFILHFVNGRSLYFKKNEKYWNKENVHLEQLSFAYKDPYQDGDKKFQHTYDMVIPHPTDQNENLENGKELLTVQEDSIYFALLNNKSTLFSNKKLRQAVAHLLDQAQIAAKVPSMVPADGLISKGISGSIGKYYLEYGVSLLDYDVAKAKRLVAEAKKELGISELPVVQFVVDESNREYAHINEMVRLLEEGGLHVQLIFVEPFEWVKIYAEGNYDLGVMGWNFDYDNPLNLLEAFESSNAQNFLHYNNATYDTKLNKAKREQDLEKRFELIQSAERQLIEDAIIVPLYSFEYNYLKHLYVKGVNDHTYGSPLDFSQVYITGRQD